MKQRLINNIGLKILAVLVSLVLWLIAINITDPVSSVSYNVSVQLQNLSSLTSAGKYVEVINGSDKIRVTVRGTRSSLSAFSSSDIVATADLSKIDSNNQVPIELNAAKISDKIESIKSDAKYVDFNVEKMSNLQLPIDVEVQNVPAEGYILGTTQTAQNVVIISGPESAVSEVSYAAVEINVEGATSDVNISLPVHLYNAEDEIIDSSKLSMSKSEVSTTASILQTKSIPVTCNKIGTPLDGYVLTGTMEGLPSSITVAGKSGAVKNLTSIDISDAIDISDSYESTVFSVMLKNYLPEGITIVGDSDDGLINVTVGIVRAVSREMEIASDRIHITGVPDGYTVSLTDREKPLEIEVSGLRTTVDGMSESSLVAVVNVEKYLSDAGAEIEAGTFEIPAVITLPDGIKLEREAKVTVTVRKD